MSFEEAEAGLGTPAVGIHRDGRAVILDDRYDDAPVLEDGRLLARFSRTTRADAAGEEETCYLGAAVVDLFVSLTGITYDMPGWWWDLRYRVLWTWRDRQQGNDQRP